MEYGHLMEWLRCLSMDGILVVGIWLTGCRRFDVPGIFARDLRVMLEFAKEWYAEELEAPVTKVGGYMRPAQSCLY